jgi:hypothetical protein
VNLRTVTRGDAALAFAALLLLISSFLPFFTINASICSQDPGLNCSTNAWSSDNLPLLPAVFLLGIIGALLIVAAHLRPGAPRVAGIELAHWGTVLTVAALWSALWSLFGGGPDVSLGVGAYLGVLATLIGAGAAVAAPRVPALAAPLVSGQPQQGGQPQGQSGTFYHGQPVQQAHPGQPFSGPQGGGYGYPSQTGQQPSPYGYGYPQQGLQQQGLQQQSGQPFGNPAATAPAPAPTPTPAPAPEDAAPPQRDRATALLKQVQPESTAAESTAAEAAAAEAAAAAEPTPAATPATPVAPAATAPAPEPAPSFAPFWFAVPAVRTLAPEQGEGGAPVGELVPGTWYLAIAQVGEALLTQTQEGKRGVLTDTSGIQRG